MRILILSDIHANLSALEAVLAAAGEVDAAWCLGDLVGYGPSPNECVARVRQLPNLLCVQGNHDAAAVGSLPLDSFNAEARKTIDWLKHNMDAETSDFLTGLPAHVRWDQFTLVHASPRQPILEYLLDVRAAEENFAYFETDYCLVGHTHIPVVFQLNADEPRAHMGIPVPDTSNALQPRAIINPGSVGQPRDRDPRAAFALLDSESGRWEYRRVDYDIVSVQKRMQAAHLPERHIARLSSGW